VSRIGWIEVWKTWESKPGGAAGVLTPLSCEGHGVGVAEASQPDAGGPASLEEAGGPLDALGELLQPARIAKAPLATSQVNAVRATMAVAST
jgi:hypothetical protein